VQCRGWCAPDADGFCFSCAVHPVEAPAETWCVVGASGAVKAKVVRDGLTREEAIELRAKMKRDVLCHGYALWVQRDGEPIRD